MPPEPIEHCFNRLCSTKPVNNFAVTQQHHYRYAAYGEARRQGRAFLGVNLNYGCLAGQFCCNCPHHRCE